MEVICRLPAWTSKATLRWTPNTLTTENLNKDQDLEKNSIMKQPIERGGTRVNGDE